MTSTRGMLSFVTIFIFVIVVMMILRHVLLYGSGRGKDETSRQFRKLTKEIIKLFTKKFAVDVAEAGKIKRHNKSEFIFSEVVRKFEELSYFDQHTVTSQCGQTVIEMVQAFHG